MNMTFWERLKFLFDPGYLQLRIYNQNYKMIEELGAERRKLNTEKKYLWAKSIKMRDELIEKDKEILRLTMGDDHNGEQLIGRTGSGIDR